MWLFDVSCFCQISIWMIWEVCVCVCVCVCVLTGRGWRKDNVFWSYRDGFLSQVCEAEQRDKCEGKLDKIFLITNKSKP